MAETNSRVLVSLHQGGGAGSVNSVLHLALGLRSRGVHVRFVCRPGSPVEAAARAGGLEVHPVPLAEQGRRANARALGALLARHPVDLVDAHGSRDREAFTWLGLTRRLPVPAIFTRRSWPRTTWLENRLASHVATRVVALSEPVAERLARTGIARRKLVVIPPGLMTARIDGPVSPEAVAAWRARIGWDPARRTVGIVARSKDQAVVLAALPRVRTPVRLVLAGVSGALLDGPLPPIPERHAVVRLPFDPGIRPLYELLEVSLHPSRHDALPQAVLEAMALGKPVIASRATGNAAIITHEVDGLLVDPDDPGAWAGALDRVLREPALVARLAAAAPRRARVDFALDRTLDRTLALYTEVLAR